MKESLFQSLIQQSYKKVPFHSYLHALEVKNNITHINGEEKELYTVAAELHDAGHGYESFPDDEENTCKIAQIILEQFWYKNVFIEEVQFLIMGTVFRERGNLKDKKQMLLADADIAAVWWDYDFLIGNFSRFYIETLPFDELPSRKKILDFFQSQFAEFFDYLTGITGKSDNPFLCEESSRAFPYFNRNKESLAFDLVHRKDFLIDAVKTEWKHFYGTDLVLLDEIKS